MSTQKNASYGGGHRAGMVSATLFMGLVGVALAHEGMVHNFSDAKRWAKAFESKRRDTWQKPDAVVRGLALKPDDVVADIGAGTGYFAVRMAKVVTLGRVLAIDAQPNMVRYVNQRAKREKLPNLKATLASASDPGLLESVDLIFICNTYHHLQKRVEYLSRLKAHLSQGARVVIVDFKMGNIPEGPPEKHRVPVDVLDKEFMSAGYRRASLDEQTLPYQYIAQYIASSAAK